MTQQIIDVGAAPNDGEGDPIRTAFQKVNNNFSQLFTTSSNAIASGSTNISIPLSSGNANITVGNVANVAVFTTTGVRVTSLSSTGNVSGANVISNGVVSANTILTTGNANIGGNVNVTGNMYVSGNITYNDITSLEVSDPIIYLAANNITNLVDLGLVGSFDDGTYQHTGIVRDFTDGTWKFFSNVVAEPTTVVDWANAVYDPLLTGPLTSSNITANLITSNGNISAVGNVVANNVNATTYYGNAAGLTNIVAGNITGTVANATYAGQALVANTVSDNAQPNITSVGTLASLSSTGNIRGGNLVTPNYVFTTGGIYTDGYFYANGTPLAISSSTYGNANVEAYLPTSNTIIGIDGNVSNTNSNVANLTTSLSNTNANLANIASNVTTLQGQVYTNSNVAAYLPTYSGNIGNVVVTGNLSAVTPANGTNTTQVATTEFVQLAVTAAGGYGNVNVAAYLPTYTGNLVSLTGPVTTTANVTGANVNGTFYGAGTGLTGIPGANVSGTVANATYATTSGSASSANTSSTVTGNAQANITSVGTLSSLDVTGNIVGGNLSVGNGTITVNNIVNGGSNTTGNIGSSSNYFNMVFATATSAQYADLAEVYIGDTTYAPGTVLSFGGEREVTVSSVDMDVTVAGVVSTNPAYIMNTSAVDPNMVVVALTGRVPCFVTGPVTKGAMMVSNGDGSARAEKNPAMGSVIGKALESFTGARGVIEIVVGRL